MASLGDTAAIGRVWADAIFGLAEARGVADEMLEEWNGLVAVLDRHPELGRLFASPLVDANEKKAVVERLLRGRASDLLVDALQVMRSKGRLALVRGVASAFRANWLRKRGQIEVQVTSAVALTPEQRREVASVASKFAGSEAILVEKIDPALLGGFILRAGDRKFDGSVQRELMRLEEDLLARATRELLAGKDSIYSEESSRGV